MYSGMQSGYMDSVPHPSSAMGSYPSGGYPTPLHQYPSSSQYAHYGSGHSTTGMPPPPPPPLPHRTMMGSSGGGGSHGPGTPGSVAGEMGSNTPSQSMDGYQVSVCACVPMHMWHVRVIVSTPMRETMVWL